MNAVARNDEAGTVVPFPMQRMATAATAAVSAVGTWDVDDWGRDASFARLVGRMLDFRWSIEVGGAEGLPTEGPALVVVNSRRLMLSPWFAALAIGRATGRPARFVGRPDSAPIGSVARRLGGLLARPDEVAGALRAGQLLVVGATAVFDPRKVGDVDHRIVGAAVRTKAPVFPATVVVAPIGRNARIEVGKPIRAPRQRRGPLAELELADRVTARLVDSLDTSGPARTGTPLDWIPLSVGGGR